MRLRPYKSYDAKKIISWIKDEEVFLKWGGDHFGLYPISAEIIDNKYLNDNGDCKEEDNFYPWIAFTDEDGVIGHFIMRYIHGNNKVLRFGWVIVDDSIRGVHTVTIGVFEHNDIAHSCYKKVGFVDKEIVPHERDNIIEMAITKEDYLLLTKL